MTPDEIAADRETTRIALNDQAHPWHRGTHLLVSGFDQADEKGQAFIRTVAPYAFETDGRLIRPKESRPCA